MMSLAKKLNAKKSGLTVHGRPEDVDLDDLREGDEGVLAFVSRQADLQDHAMPALEAAAEDKVAWIAYPKDGKLGTDLDPDKLRAAVTDIAPSIHPVRQVSVDGTWCALLFRPA